MFAIHNGSSISSGLDVKELRFLIFVVNQGDLWSTIVNPKVPSYKLESSPDSYTP